MSVILVAVEGEDLQNHVEYALSDDEIDDTVLDAKTVGECQRLFAEYPIDLVILTATFDGQHGYEVFERLRTMATNLHVIFLLRREEQGDERMNNHNSTQSWSPRPLVEEEFIELVDGLLPD